VAAAVAIVIVAAVIVGIVIGTRSDGSSAVKATTTTASPRNLTAPRAAIAALNFKTFKSTDPAFTIQTPGGARLEASAENARFGPAAGASVRWTLYVLPSAPGVDLKSELAVAAGRGGGQAAPTADTGAPGTHIDELVTIGRGGLLVHVVQGTNNVFVLSVPLRSGGSLVTGRAIFNQMAGSLRAAGIGS
jgi:hypothetical protein